MTHDAIEICDYSIDTFAHGLFVEITRLVDGHVRFLQGESAVALIDELDRSQNSHTVNDLISAHFD